MITGYDPDHPQNEWNQGAVMDFKEILALNYPHIGKYWHAGPELPLQKFTDAAIAVLNAIVKKALELEIRGIVPPMLVLWCNLLRWNESGRLGFEVLKACGVDRQLMEADIRQELSSRADSSDKAANWDKICELARLAVKETVHLKRNYVGSEHLVLALFKIEDPAIAQLFRKHGVTYENFQARLAELMGD